MKNKDVEALAKREGFQKVKYMGTYNGKECYKPLNVPEQDIGLPFFILVINDEPKLVTGKMGLKILDYFIKTKK